MASHRHGPQDRADHRLLFLGFSATDSLEDHIAILGGADKLARRFQRKGHCAGIVESHHAARRRPRIVDGRLRRSSYRRRRRGPHERLAQTSAVDRLGNCLGGGLGIGRRREDWRSRLGRPGAVGLWLFANGQWNEPLLLTVKDRTTISSNTTLPYDEPDYEAALTFTLSEATRLIGQLRREQMQTREISLTIRFTDFSEAGGSHRFQHPQFQNSVINATLEGIFREIMSGPSRPVRQIRIAMWNLTRLDTQPTLWGRTNAERWGALDEATKKLQEQLGKTTPLLTGAQLALQKLDGVHKNPKAKCPFVPQREMVKKLWGTDADPLAHKGEWEQRLAKVSKQLQFNH